MNGFRKLGPAAVTVLLATGITGCSSSSGGSAAKDGSAKPSQTNTTTDPSVHLSARFTSHNGVDDPTQVRITGAISDAGTETQKTSDSASGETGTLTLHLAHGTVAAKFSEGDFQMHFDAAACKAAPTSTGTITIASGTGAYKGASGKLTFTTAGKMNGARDAHGACIAQSKPPISSDIVLSATGKVTLKK